MTEGETPITSIRFPEEQLAAMDDAIGEDGDRSAFIRRATGDLIYRERARTGRTDAIDRIAAECYGLGDEEPVREPLPDHVMAAVDSIHAEPARDAGYAARIEIGAGAAYHGFGETPFQAVSDGITTVSALVQERASSLYGVEG